MFKFSNLAVDSGSYNSLLYGTHMAERVSGFQFIHAMDHNRLTPYVKTGKYEGYIDVNRYTEFYIGALEFALNNQKQVCFTSDDSWDSHTGMSILVSRSKPDLYLPGDVGSFYCETPGCESQLTTVYHPGEYACYPPPAPQSSDEAWFNIASVERKNIKVLFSEDRVRRSMLRLADKQDIDYRFCVNKIREMKKAIRSYCRSVGVKFGIKHKRWRQKYPAKWNGLNLEFNNLLGVPYTENEERRKWNSEGGDPDAL